MYDMLDIRNGGKNVVDKKEKLLNEQLDTLAEIGFDGVDCGQHRLMLSGLPASGKDTVAEYLAIEYGFHVFSFAEGIYQIAQDYFGMEVKDRQLLRDIGEKMREIDSNVWVKSTFKKANAMNRAVITDCRRNNEYEIGVVMGYTPVMITMPEEKRIKILTDRGDLDDKKLTESETQALDRDFIEVRNFLSKQYLFAQVDNIMKDMGVDRIEESRNFVSGREFCKKS